MACALVGAGAFGPIDVVAFGGGAGIRGGSAVVRGRKGHGDLEFVAIAGYLHAGAEGCEAFPQPQETGAFGPVGAATRGVAGPIVAYLQDPPP